MAPLRDKGFSWLSDRSLVHNGIICAGATSESLLNQITSSVPLPDERIVL